jgi:hypothetical protein
MILQGMSTRPVRNYGVGNDLDQFLFTWPRQSGFIEASANALCNSENQRGSVC